MRRIRRRRPPRTQCSLPSRRRTSGRRRPQGCRRGVGCAGCRGFGVRRWCLLERWVGGGVSGRRRAVNLRGLVARVRLHRRRSIGSRRRRETRHLAEGRRELDADLGEAGGVDRNGPHRLDLSVPGDDEALQVHLCGELGGQLRLASPGRVGDLLVERPHTLRCFRHRPGVAGVPLEVVDLALDCVHPVVRLQLRFQRLDLHLVVTGGEAQAVGFQVGGVRPAASNLGQCPLLSRLLAQLLRCRVPRLRSTGLALEVGGRPVGLLRGCQLSPRLQLGSGPFLLLTVGDAGQSIPRHAEAFAVVDEPGLVGSPSPDGQLVQVVGPKIELVVVELVGHLCSLVGLVGSDHRCRRRACHRENSRLEPRSPDGSGADAGGGANRGSSR